MASDFGSPRLACVEPPANATFFEFSASTRWSQIAGGVFACALLVSIAFFRPPPMFAVTCVATSILFGVITMRDVRYLRDRVAVSDHGVWYLPHAGTSTFLQWDEVASLDLRDGRFQGRLVLSDKTRLRKIRLDFRLNQFAQLFWFVVNRTAERRQRQPVPSISHRGHMGRTLLIVVMVLVAVLCTRAGQSKAAMCFALITAVGFAELSFDPRTVVVSTRSISIGYLGRRRELPFESVTDVQIGLLQGGKGDLSTVVVVNSVGERRVKLIGFKEGSVALYDSLHGAWQTAKKSKSAQATATA
jgi:hypothetical protein